MPHEPFSVAMCVYAGDDAAHFDAAVQSILDQTRPPDEVVLVVDGPIGAELAAVVEKYAAMPQFSVERLAENGGQGNARRAGFARCTHDLVALMDADDVSVPDRFEKQLLAFAADPALCVVGGNIAEFEGTTEHVIGYRTVPHADAAVKKEMKKRCPMNQVTVMMRRTAADAAGGYLDWYGEEDYYLWLRMAANGARFANVGDVLVYVRVDGATYRRRGGWRYFKSEAALQKYMRRTGVIGPFTRFFNVGKRFLVQVLMPNCIRALLFKKFARSKTNEQKI